MGPAQCDPTVSLPRSGKTLSSPPAKWTTTTCRYCCSPPDQRALMKRNADENLKPTPHPPPPIPDQCNKRSCAAAAGRSSSAEGGEADVLLRGYYGWNSRRAIQVLDQVFPKDASVQPTLVIVYFGGNDSMGPHSLVIVYFGDFLARSICVHLVLILSFNLGIMC
ncbi:hypothetical protein MTR67_012225 [Solanum verrucosum]|uniref:Uncharacterized protein n=1 Tax=Solanum verrucosum TaxID=315347 RepID=A0AAF0QCL4_SOLVR|nr:hypothetical protein MTR67_012225 [Solanum verrucosum]